MLSAILSHVGTVQLDWDKAWVLVPLYTLAAAGVVLGVHWEESEKLTCKRLGKRLLLICLLVEVVVGFLIVEIDDAISDAQLSKIIALERISPRIVPSPEKIAGKLKPFAPLVMEVMTTAPLAHAFDVDSLEAQIANVGALAGWKMSPQYTPGPSGRPSGVWVGAREGEKNAEAAAEVLVAELNVVGIVAHKDPKPFAGPKGPKPPDPSPDDAGRIMVLHWQQQWEEIPDIQVIVGTKP